MSNDISVTSVTTVHFKDFHIYRYAGVSDDPGIEDMRVSWEARDIVDRAIELCMNDTNMGSWNKINAICFLRNVQRHLLWINTWEFTFNE